MTVRQFRRAAKRRRHFTRPDPNLPASVDNPMVPVVKWWQRPFVFVARKLI